MAGSAHSFRMPRAHQMLHSNIFLNMMNLADLLEDVVPPDAALHEYASLLSRYDGGDLDEVVFVKYFGFVEEDGKKSIQESCYSRKEFLQLVTRAIQLFSSRNITKGTKVLHNFSANRLEDLIIRAAAIFLGIVPVTVNWQADSTDQIKYKLEITHSEAVVYDQESLAMAELRAGYPHVQFIDCQDVHKAPPIEDFLGWIASNTNNLPLSTDIRCIIFTSGTTGRPKGVNLSYNNYTCNRYTFEKFLELGDGTTSFVPVIVNPMHHTNSTSITDWALRRANTTLHLIEKYTSQYWMILAAAVADESAHTLEDSKAADEVLRKITDLSLSQRRRIVAPLVSRHLDFLENLMESSSICVSKELLSTALRQCILLLGSAPVGPFTVHRVQKYSQNNLPIVRFGSTETTLQVCGIPYAFPTEAILQAYQRGWEHKIVNIEGQAELSVGYYIGQQHEGLTEVKIVKSIDPTSSYYMQDCAEGENGYIVTRGGHIMQSYVNSATDHTVINEDGWYLKLGDVGFHLVNAFNNKQDLYWQSRDSQMLIRGGANYAYEQVNAELSSFVASQYSVPTASFKLAVCGVKIHSEHEDSCCVMLEVLDEALWTKEVVEQIKETFLSQAKKKVSKGAKPDYFSIGAIPIVQSKGVVDIPGMTTAWKKELNV